jgi:hypothetical protein
MSKVNHVLMREVVGLIASPFPPVAHLLGAYDRLANVLGADRSIASSRG